jgi:hypothetical protein
VRCDAIDATTAHLIVPFGQAEDSSTVAFDERTGLIRSMESLRYRAPTDEARIPERFEPLGWRTFHGIRIPSSGALTWLDRGTPWLVMTIEEVAYNVDVSERIRSRGP